jgi:hypothetical protein
MKVRYIVPRISADEFTFAVVTADVTRRLTAAEFRNAVTQAITEWVETTDVGRRAWQASSEDFNVGDLSGYMPAHGCLRRILTKHGIRSLKIDTVVHCASPANLWTFDSVLVDIKEPA